MCHQGGSVNAYGLVKLRDACPGLLIDMRYATEGNFFRSALYDSGEAWLLEPTAAKLRRAQERLETLGYRLLVLDAYRPLSVQARMWAILPDPDFVAPMTRGSNHNRGAAVDVSLADSQGQPLPMQSPFDDFSERASHDWAGASPEDRERRESLRAAMEGAGFSAYSAEWWHYTDPETRTSPLIDVSIASLS